jgi:hypothetical protein
MGLLGTTNTTLSNQITQQGQSDFKVMNNLLTLQENHVEDFFQYHGEAFLMAFEKLIEDVTERVVSQMLVKLKFVTNSNGELSVHSDALREYESITAENITLDLQQLLGSALNTEVIMQRKMAKAQYIEAQGFTSSGSNVPQGQGMQQGMPMGNPQGMNPSNIQGNNAAVGMNNMMMQQQNAMNNASGYPIPPSGYDNMNNPYWIDPQTGQPTYTPPASGLGLGNAISKGLAWASWLA